MILCHFSPAPMQLIRSFALLGFARHVITKYTGRLKMHQVTSLSVNVIRFPEILPVKVNFKPHFSPVMP